MANAIQFYFEFSSPYGYLASERIEAIAARHGREILWKPFLLGIVFKQAGTGPLLDVPLKGDYSKRDIERTARLHDIPYHWPPRFPFLSVNAARLVYWAGPGMAPALTHAFYRAAYAQGRDLHQTAVVLDVADEAGLDREASAQAIKDPGVKARLAEETQAAIDLGVCGAPFFLVGDEPFWGHDRLEMLDRWLETGGW
jgi:2-hydroxychromene-2-carboxylate isomerase